VDSRNQEVWNFQRIVGDLQPKAFVMENVDGLLTTGQQQRGELRLELERGFEKIRYRTYSALLDAVDYRVPQRRKRLIMVGIRGVDRPFCFPPPLTGDTRNLFAPVEPIATVADALADLPTPIASEPQPYDKDPMTWLQLLLREDSETLHEHTPSKHSPEMVRRLTAQPIATRLYPNWNHSWYKLDPARPSPAVKENHRAPFVHFAEPRVTTPRECARLQTFPDRYRILGTKTAQLIQVGNAVPALLAATVATALAAALGADSEVSRPNGLPRLASQMTAGA